MCPLIPCLLGGSIHFLIELLRRYIIIATIRYNKIVEAKPDQHKETMPVTGGWTKIRMICKCCGLRRILTMLYHSKTSHTRSYLQEGRNGDTRKHHRVGAEMTRFSPDPKTTPSGYPSSFSKLATHQHTPPQSCNRHPRITVAHGARSARLRRDFGEGRWYSSTREGTPTSTIDGSRHDAATVFQILE
jgi:hypothetical protein